MRTWSLVLGTMGSMIGSATLVSADGVDKPETSSGPDPVFELGTMVVLGTAEAAGPGVEIRTTAADLELLEKRDLAQALALTPGVTLTRFGGRNETAVYIRGFARNQTPLFVDGVPVYVPYDGIIDLGRFTTYDVAAIDVAKGYSSALFGPNTMGGAINLVTRRPTQELEGQVSAGFLSGYGYEASLNAGARRGRFYGQVGASYLDRDHWDLSDDFKPTALEDGGQRDNSYSTDWKVTAKAGFIPNATDEYAIGFIHQEGEKGNPVQTTSAKFWRWPQWDKETIYAITTTRLGESSYLKLRPYYDTYDNSLSIYDDGSYTTQNRSSSSTSIYNEYTYGGSVELGTSLIPQNTLKAIAHYKFDHHKEHPNVTRQPTVSYTDEDESLSLGVEDTWRAGKHWTVQAGASYDTRDTVAAVDTTNGRPFDLTDFSSFNPQAGIFYHLTDTSTVRLTAAHKSRFPTMKERYSYRMGNGLPNPELDAEEAMHYELGYAGTLATGLYATAALFFSRIEDTIQNVYLSPTSTISQFQNIGTSEKSGAELGLNYMVNDKLSLGGGVAYLRQKTLTTLPRNTEPVRATDTPGRTGFIHLQVRPTSTVTLVPSAEFSSWRYSFSDGRGNTRTLPGYTLVHLKASFRLPDSPAVVSVGLENIFDRNYALQEGYPEAGRSWYANIRYSF